MYSGLRRRMIMPCIHLARYPVPRCCLEVQNDLKRTTNPARSTMYAYSISFRRLLLPSTVAFQLNLIDMSLASWLLRSEGGDCIAMRLRMLLNLRDEEVCEV